MHIVIDGRIRRSSTGRYADRLIEHIQRLDTQNQYTILIQPDDPWQPTNPNFKAVPCKYPQFSLNPFDELGFTRQLKQLKPDLVHFTMTQQPLLFRGNIVTTTHDLTMLRFLRPGKTPLPIFWFKRALYKYLFDAAHNKSRRIIVPSKYVQADLHQYAQNTNTKTAVTYEASEPPLAMPGEQPQRVNQPYILYVGTAFPHKNLEKLVEAFELLYAKNPQLQLVLAGKKEFYYEQLEKKVLLSPASSNIIITGFVKDSELKWLYENAKAYIFPSLSEGFGLPGLEAMAHNCPVVSSNATCLPEIYRDGAMYFDPNNAEDMAEKIHAVIDHETLAQELVARGQEVLKLYSWEKCAQETLGIYRSLL